MEDAEDIDCLFQDSEAMRLADMLPAFTGLNQTQERIRKWIEMGIHRAIVLKSTNRVIGFIVVKEAKNPENNNNKEIGYSLCAHSRRKGYAKDALELLLDNLFENGIKEVKAVCFKENIASEKLLKSLGFSKTSEGEYLQNNKTLYKTIRYSLKNN